MKTCVFFGHRTCPDAVSGELAAVVDQLIEEEDVSVFYVGNQGQFDEKVWKVLNKAKEKYPYIKCFNVLAYMPGKAKEQCRDTILPEGVETVHPKYAIDRRNRWMISEADIVVCYVTHTWGGAAKYAELAKKKGKRVLMLGEH